MEVGLLFISLILNTMDTKSMTTKELKQEAKSLHQTIYEVGSYGSTDLRIYDAILAELDKRGVEINSEITFN